MKNWTVAVFQNTKKLCVENKKEREKKRGRGEKERVETGLKRERKEKIEKQR